MDFKSLNLGTGTWTLLLLLVLLYSLGAIFRSSSANLMIFDSGMKFLVIGIAARAGSQFLTLFVPLIETRGAMSFFAFASVVFDLIVVVFALLALRSLVFAYLRPAGSSSSTPPLPLDD